MSRAALALALLAALAFAACSDSASGPDAPSCDPSCAGRACGDDGCGGSCGTCPSGTSCDAAFACVADDPEPVACPGSGSCALIVHEAWLYDCTRASATAPWTCTALLPDGAFASQAACDMQCTEGQSACHEGDTDVGAECRACQAGCATPVRDVCPGATADACPAPCACG